MKKKRTYEIRITIHSISATLCLKTDGFCALHIVLCCSYFVVFECVCNHSEWYSSNRQLFPYIYKQAFTHILCLALLILTLFMCIEYLHLYMLRCAKPFVFSNVYTADSIDLEWHIDVSYKYMYWKEYFICSGGVNLPVCEFDCIYLYCIANTRTFVVSLVRIDCYYVSTKSLDCLFTITF